MSLIRINKEEDIVSALVREFHYIVDGDVRAFIESDRSVRTAFIHYNIPAFRRDVKTGRDAQGFLSRGTWELDEDLTWDKSSVHLRGIAPSMGTNQPVKIALALGVEESPMISFTANGCHFSNLELAYGSGSTVNLSGVEISGDNNVFENIHFNGPNNATEAGEADFTMLSLSGKDNYFKNCVIGSEKGDRDAANTLLTILNGANGNVFDNCRFLSYNSAGDPFYIRVDTAVASGATHFKNCYATSYSTDWATPLTLAIDFQPATTTHRLFCSGFTMFNATDIVANGKEAAVVFTSYPAVNTSIVDDVGIGLPLIPDHTA